MPNLCRCARCNDPLEPAQHLRFLVETDTLDDPAYLARIRVLPAANGRPVPVCKACQTALDTAPPARTKPLAKSWLGVFGALTVGVLFGSLFASRG